MRMASSRGHYHHAAADQPVALVGKDGEVLLAPPRPLPLPDCDADVVGHLCDPILVWGEARVQDLEHECVLGREAQRAIRPVWVGRMRWRGLACSRAGTTGVRIVVGQGGGADDTDHAAQYPREVAGHRGESDLPVYHDGEAMELGLDIDEVLG
ncbi:hypothetical protein DMH26_07580 [Streptomyces sp. WAC 05379]|nr:hypothetical protein DMH26_07580 [Streptomyces sp. WAC 05379]